MPAAKPASAKARSLWRATLTPAASAQASERRISAQARPGAARRTAWKAAKVSAATATA